MEPVSSYGNSVIGMDGQTEKAGRWECRVRCPPEGDQVFVPSVLEARGALSSVPSGSRALEASAATGTGPIVGNSVALCRLTCGVQGWGGRGQPRPGPEGGHPGMCVCSRACVWVWVLFNFFFFSQQILFTYSIETGM